MDAPPSTMEPSSASEALASAPALPCPSSARNMRLTLGGEWLWEPPSPPRRWYTIRDQESRPPSPDPSAPHPPADTEAHPPADTEADRQSPGSGWPDEMRQVPGIPQAWTGDFHPQSRWNGSVPGYAAALMFNAAYDAAQGEHLVVPELDLRWHRPDQVGLDPRGYNARGDLAPPEVHLALDVLLESRTLSDLETRLLHHWIDFVWLRHSRSPIRVAQVIKALGVFSEEEVVQLEAIVRAHALTDFRWVMHCVDPRDRPVYGRTLDGPGKSRLFRMFRLRFNRVKKDPATWDEDDGGESGSSHAGSEPRPYAPLNAWQRFEQRMRWAERRMRRVLDAVHSAEDEAARQENRLADAVDRVHEGRSLLDVILRGLRARRGPFAGDRPVPEIVTWRV